MALQFPWWSAGLAFVTAGDICPGDRDLTPKVVALSLLSYGSQAQFTIPEILDDMHRAVRFIQANAAAYKIDPNRIGITGGSAGGHLSLMQAMSGKKGDSEAKGPIDRQSSRVQVVACFSPPTDFLNCGKPGEYALVSGFQGRGALFVAESELAVLFGPGRFQTVRAS
ncbi:MAG: hypothetical protein M2R45_04118 [Verrucomicrobia subdivision 3 bacterium]|nr:hypothetical protein [Limisphaerales bacterium]MCS1417079.1 hypothetical protein [Limisphaerales bacterium]